MANLDLQAVGKSFSGTPALQDVTATIGNGEFVALLGPSGCGKTTMLRLLAGFEMPTEGSIHIGGVEVANGATGHLVQPEKRNIGIVFQSYALWPHMSVRRNVSYPLEVKKLSKAERHARTEAALAATELQAFADRMPSELSGGQRQRVALARCLVTDPSAVLLDEPLANLDVALRASMQDVFSDFHQRTGATMVYVTHDQSEAMAMADRIAVMSEGRIVQFDTPEGLYNQPMNRFVAEFIGEGCVVPVANPVRRADGLHDVDIFGAQVTVRSQDDVPKYACLRPENIVIEEQGVLRARVARTTYLGGRFRMNLDTDAGSSVVVESRTRYVEGEQFGLSVFQPWAFAEA